MPSLGAQYSYMLYPVTNAEAFNLGKITNFDQVGFKVLDDYTLQLTLHSPTPYLLSMMVHDSWYPVPIATIKKYGAIDDRTNPWTRPEHFVGNGPFVLKEWRMNSHILVVKSPTYWDAAHVRLNSIYFDPEESYDTEERMFRSGQLHTIRQAPPSKVAFYRKYKPQLDQRLSAADHLFLQIQCDPPAVERQARPPGPGHGHRPPRHHRNRHARRGNPGFFLDAARHRRLHRPGPLEGRSGRGAAAAGRGRLSGWKEFPDRDPAFQHPAKPQGHRRSPAGNVEQEPQHQCRLAQRGMEGLSGLHAATPITTLAAPAGAPITSIPAPFWTCFRRDGGNNETGWSNADTTACAAWPPAPATRPRVTPPFKRPRPF